MRRSSQEREAVSLTKGDRHRINFNRQTTRSLVAEASYGHVYERSRWTDYLCDGEDMDIRFIVDNNVGRLARWLRLMGYDALLCRQRDDASIIRTALDEDRVVLTRDRQFMRRRLVTRGTLRVVLIEHDDPRAQIGEVVRALSLDCHRNPFSLCLECNRALVARSRSEVRGLVPPHVFQTQTQYSECPACRRIYWQGSHWQAMVKSLGDLQRDACKDDTHR